MSKRRKKQRRRAGTGRGAGGQARRGAGAGETLAAAGQARPALAAAIWPDIGPWALRLLLCLSVLYVAVSTGWVTDDARITMRQVWNFVNGDGMTINVGDRVQAFSHPAWFLLLSGLVAVTRELFVSTLALSFVLAGAAVAMLIIAEWRLNGRVRGGKRLPWLTPALLLPFSIAFCDYMTSGLENPLSYFLVGLLVWCLASDGLASQRRWLFLLMAALVLTRFDYAALFLPLALLLALGWHSSTPPPAKTRFILTSRVSAAC